jgi:transposase IS166 family protein
MTLDPAKLLDQIATLKEMLVEHAERIASEKRAADAEARASGLEGEVRTRPAEIEALKLTIAKLQRNTFGTSSERGKKLLDQLELQLAELEESAAEDKAAADVVKPCAPAISEKATPKSARRPLPSHLPRERVVQPAPSACPCCGESLRKLGEDINETQEHVPAQWKSDPALAREVLLPQMRGRHAGARTLASNCARDRAGPQLLAPSTGRATSMPTRRRRSRHFDADRLGGGVRGDADAAGRGDPQTRVRRRTHPRRRQCAAEVYRRDDQHDLIELCAQVAMTMRAGPSGSAFRSRSQTTPKRLRLRGAVVSVGAKFGEYPGLVRIREAEKHLAHRSKISVELDQTQPLLELH